MYIYTHNTHNGKIPFSATLDEPRNYHINEVSQAEKDKPYITYTQNLKRYIQMNLFTKQKNTHRHRKQTYGYQRGNPGRDKLGVWDEHLYTVMYKINKKAPTVQHRELYSIPCNNL